MGRLAPASSSWLTDNEEQPRADTLSGNRFRRRARFYRVYLLVSAVLAPLLLLALVAAVSAVPAPTSASPPVLDSAGRAAATQAMLDWLSGPKPGLVDGRLLLWSGARVVQAPVTESASTAGDIAYSTEVDTFVVADGAGQRFTAEFQVALDGQGRARVLTLTWDVTRTTELPGTAAAKTTSGQSVSFDVLVTGADTAAPRVVAWGGPGSRTHAGAVRQRGRDW